MAGADIEDTLLVLDWVLCIYYLVWFKNNGVWALINFNNKVNAITLNYAANLGLKIRHTNLGVQKIDGSTFKTLKMVLANF